MNDTTSAADIRSTSAAGELLATLTRIGGAAVVLYAITYYAGWSEEQTYYSNLGCSWVLAMLPTSVLLQAALPSIWGFALFGLLGARVVADSKDAVRTSNRLASTSLYIASGIALVLGALPSYLQPKTVYLIAMADNLAFYVATGFVVGELLATFTASKLKWESRNLFLVYIVAIFGLWAQPMILGNARANFNGDSVASHLAKVSVPGTEKGEDWRIVAALDQEILVVRLATRPQDRTFRLVKPEQVGSVSSDRRW